MVFWGVELKPGEPVIHPSETARGRLRISHATLGISNATKKCILQCTIELEFEEADDVVFSVIGTRSVHLTGYYITQSEQSSPSPHTDFVFNGMDIKHTSHTPRSQLAHPGMTSDCFIASRSSWIVDSGATDHMTGNKSILSDLATTSQPPVQIANGSTCKIDGVGCTQLSPNMPLSSVLYVPSFPENLMSVSKITEQLNCSVTFTPTKCIFQELGTNRLIGTAYKEQGLYYMKSSPQRVAYLSTRSAQEVHYQLGHPSLRAIELYSRANHIKPGDYIVLSNRCVAYLRICQFLRNRPPSASEYRPLNGLDPTTHAGLALNDAEKVMSLHSNLVTSYILKANAFIMLEKYEFAQDVIRSGLQIDPQSNALVNLERLIANTFSGRSHVKPQRTDDYDCTLCLKLLYEPITTPCGHSFCRSCLFQSMDRGNRCPLCRTVLFISPRTCAISVTLNNIIQKNFPEEYAERKLEHHSLTNPGPDLLPLFAMDVILPCQKLQLNIFEPRYRLMVRRIMEGNRRMGMVVIEPSTGSVVDYACEVEITDCEPLPDGRFYLEVESRRRCRIIQNWDQDGYRVAAVEWVEDICLPEGTESNDLVEMTQKAAVFARQWIKDAQEAAQGDRIRLAELFKAEGLIPPTRDPERFSFWLATLTNRRPSERLDLLRLRDTKERIRRGLLYMKAEEQGCRLQ